MPPRCYGNRPIPPNVGGKLKYMGMNAISRKTNYFYIDESGHVSNDSKVFLMGCIKTDTPLELERHIINLKEELLDDIYFSSIKEKFKKQGFHAAENHPDIRARVYGLLPLLNYRSYFVILNKTDEYFEELSKAMTPSEVYGLAIRKLLKDRIIKNRNDNNIFIFENINLPDISLRVIIDNFFKEYQNFHNEYYITDKKNVILSIVDYLNYILFSLLETKQFQERMKENFELMKPKIGSIHLINNDIYLSRRNELDLDVLLKLFCG
jgi:hypothetical protein